MKAVVARTSGPVRLKFLWKPLRRRVKQAIARLAPARLRPRHGKTTILSSLGLRRGAERQLIRLNQAVGFAGKNVLEIGGDLEGKLATACLAVGARHVTSINHDDNFQTREDARMKFVKMDAADLDFDGDQFDLVIGFAVLEHIRGLERVLKSVHRVLKPGGSVYLQGGPLWYSRKGHHVIVTGPSGRVWRFDGQPGSANPLEDWEHLLREPPELRNRLIEKGCPVGDAHAIADCVFGSDLINRYSASRIKQRFKSSRFEILECVETRQAMAPARTLAALSRRHALPESEFETSSIAFLLRK